MKSKTTEILIGAAALLASFCAQGEFAYNMTKKVTGYAGTSVLTDVPLLVRLPTECTSMCKPDGSDLQFTSPDGATVYPHEIDTWRTDGESLVWVKLPAMENGTTFVMNWGDPDYTAPTVKGAVWDDAGFIGVWHMSEESGVVANSASARGNGDVALDAVPKGARAAYSVRYGKDTDDDAINDPAPVGYARYTGAKHSDTDSKNYRAYLEVPNYDCQNLSSNFVISGWYRMSEYKGEWTGYTRNARVFSRKYESSGAGGFSLALNRRADEMNLRGGYWSGDGIILQNAALSADKKWVHVSFAFDGIELKVYANGNLINANNKTLKEKEAYEGKNMPLGIGSNVNPGMNNDSYVAGSFDEVRLRRAAHGVDYGDWIKAEYDMCSKGDFVTDVGSSVPLAACATEMDGRSAKATLTVTDLGYGADSCTVTCGIAREGETVSYTEDVGTVTERGQQLAKTFGPLDYNVNYEIGFKLENSQGAVSYKSVIVRVRILEGAVCLVPDAANPPAGAAEKGFCVSTVRDAVDFVSIATDKRVFVYPGSYKPTGNVVVPANVAFLSQASGPDADRPVITLDRVSLQLGKNAKMDGLTVTGSGVLTPMIDLDEDASLEHTILTNCTGFVYLVRLRGKGSKLIGCRLIDSQSLTDGTSVVICGGAGGNVIEDTVISNCKVNWNRYGAPLQLWEDNGSGGSVREGSLVMNRVSLTGCAGRAGAIRQDSGSIYCTNCLFSADDASDGTSYTIVTCNSAQRLELVNTTVAKNRGYGINCVSGQCRIGGVVVNSILWDNTGKDGKTRNIDNPTDRMKVSYSCYAEAAPDNVDGNISADPCLKPDCTLSFGSPCVNRGFNFGWTDEDIDLAGNPRVRAKKVDMGCFENQSNGLMVIIR